MEWIWKMIWYCDGCSFLPTSDGESMSDGSGQRLSLRGHLRLVDDGRIENRIEIVEWIGQVKRWWGGGDWRRWGDRRRLGEVARAGDARRRHVVRSFRVERTVVHAALAADGFQVAAVLRVAPSAAEVEPAQLTHVTLGIDSNWIGIALNWLHVIEQYDGLQWWPHPFLS